jgi:hypothetical protein
MPGRRNRVPNVYNVHIPVDIAAHAEAAHALLVAVIKHLSYAREQCHAPYTQLELHAKVRQPLANICIPATPQQRQKALCNGPKVSDCVAAGLQAATAAAVRAARATQAIGDFSPQGCQGTCAPRTHF